MRDLLQQAIDDLVPKQRAECNLYLALIQNQRNTQHDEFCDLPSNDLNYALDRLCDRALQHAAFSWEQGWTVKGLA
jgi:hypothetical protein